MKRRSACPHPGEVHGSILYVPRKADPRECIDLCGYDVVKKVRVDFKLVADFVSAGTNIQPVWYRRDRDGEEVLAESVDVFGFILVTHLTANIGELSNREMERDISNLSAIHPYLRLHPVRGVHRRIKARLDELRKALMQPKFAEARRQDSNEARKEVLEDAQPGANAEVQQQKS